MKNRSYMRALVGLMALLLMAVGMTVPTAAESNGVVWDMTDADTAQTFVGGRNAVLVKVGEEGLEITPNGDDPIIMHDLKPYDIQMAEYKYLKVKFKATAEKDNCFEYFFNSVEDPTQSGEKRYQFEYKPNVWTEALVDLTTNSQWKNGKLEVFRFDPFGAYYEGDVMVVEYFAFFQTKADADAFGGLTEKQKQENQAVLDDAAGANGTFFENGAFVMRFDSIPAINRVVTSTYGTCLGFLDKSAMLDYFWSPGILTFSFEEYNRFSADEYKYMKIKYYANTMMKDSIIYFATESSPEITGDKSFSFKRGRNQTWREDIVDIAPKAGAAWSGRVTSFRFDVNTNYSKRMDEYTFIEYIAFFKTKEEAEAFGGLTEEQKNGTDLISLYGKGYRTSRVDGITYTVPGEAPETDDVATTDPTVTDAVKKPVGSLSIGATVGILAGGVAVAVIIIVAAVAVAGKKKA